MGYKESLEASAAAAKKEALQKQRLGFREIEFPAASRAVVRRAGWDPIRAMARNVKTHSVFTLTMKRDGVLRVEVTATTMRKKRSPTINELAEALAAWELFDQFAGDDWQFDDYTAFVEHVKR